MSRSDERDAGDTKHICHECIGEAFLAAEVKSQGLSGLCDQCGIVQGAITLWDLADRIHEVLKEHFQLTPPYPDEPYEYMMANESLWERRGDPVKDVIGDLAELEPDIVDQIVALLSGQNAYGAMRAGEEDPYGNEAMYEARDPDASSFRYTWDEFRQHVRSRSRFFSEEADKMLTFIFGDLNSHVANDGTPVVREIKHDDKYIAIWRGRRAQSEQDIERILKAPAREMGAPLSSSAKAGRMNAEGISVFYGATDQGTCVSEVRATVGGRVVLARFELLRPIKLLDLDALANVYAHGGCFDPEFVQREGRAEFFRQLVSEISRPVMPQDEALEYISTQVVAEYLAHRVNPRIDGIIFGSSQTGGDGRNLVLFNHACGVEPYTLLIGTDIDIYLPHEEDEDKDVFVWETVPSVPPGEQHEGEGNAGSPGSIRSFEDAEVENAEHHDSPTLKLVLESMEVLDINGVRYDSYRRGVTRHKQTQEERDAFHQHFTDFDGLLDVPDEEDSEKHG